jgi:hypothetical protein
MMLENNNITNKTQEKALINDENEIKQNNKGNIKDRITSGNLFRQFRGVI